MAQIKRILVPTDFSENAASVYKMVKKSAEKYGATVDFIHVIQNPRYYDISKDPLGNVFEDKDAYTKLRKQIEERLQEKLTNLFEEENRGKAIIKNNDRPWTSIAEHAKTERYDLIIMAKRGYHQSTFNRGSVTEKLVRMVNTPILTVNKGYDPAIEAVVVPTDGSKISLEALPMALLVAAQNEAKIHLLRVSKEEGLAANITGGKAYKYSNQELKEKIFESLKAYVSNQANSLSFKGEPSAKSETIRLENDFGEEVDLMIRIQKGVSAHAAIVNYAVDNAQLVVMATHGRSKMAYIFLGSTTEKVVRHLKMPVMTIKPEFVQNQ